MPSSVCVSLLVLKVFLLGGGGESYRHVKRPSYKSLHPGNVLVVSVYRGKE